MFNLTTQQQTDLVNWKQDEKLPESLKNVFIEDCLEELKNNEEARNKFNLMGKEKEFYLDFLTTSKTCLFKFPEKRERDLEELRYFEKQIIIQTLLSRTPDGKAVIPFLDVETKTRPKIIYNLEQLSLKELEYKPLVLDHLLYREFTEALRIGKSFDEAVGIITKIYIQNIYV